MTAIRNVQEADAARCAKIYDVYAQNTCISLEGTPLSAEEYAGRIRDVLQKGYPFLVAENDKRNVIGFAYLNVYNSRSAYRHTADLSVYADENYLHEHVGSALLSAIEAKAKEQGITNIVSTITDENENSVRFHEKHGFKQEGYLHGVAVKFGKQVGVYYYRKPL